MSQRLSINLGAVEATIAGVTSKLSAAGDANSQHLGAYNKISGDGAGSTVASASQYAQVAQSAQQRVIGAVQQANGVARTAATEAVGIDKNASTQFV